MKRIVACVLCLALAVLPAGARSASLTASRRGNPPEGPGVMMRVTAVASCDDYNHVGGDWTEELYVDDTLVALFAGDRLMREAPDLPLSAGARICVGARITEADKYSDVGYGEQTHTVTQRDLEEGFTIGFEVDVIENAGRYRRSTVTWRVQFSFVNPASSQGA